MSFLRKACSLFKRSSPVGLLALSDRVFTNLSGEGLPTYEAAQLRGDWCDTDVLVSLGRQGIIDALNQAGLRGRGGAGFPVGRKWSFMPEVSEQSYLVINADEGEPGTSKDRWILLNEPHKLLEGIVLAAAATRATKCYVYVRGEYQSEISSLRAAIAEATEAGWIGPGARSGWPIEVFVAPGAGAYVCGEETALLESLEGRPGRPRHKPPYPAQAGLWGRPTCVSNVESVSLVPSILRNPSMASSKLVSVCGAVKRPAVFEERLGAPIDAMVKHHCGGFRNLMALQPGGCSTGFLTPEEVRTATLDYESLAELGSALGTAGMICLGKDDNFLGYLARLARFYSHESCGQCIPCRVGTQRLSELMAKACESSLTRTEKMELREIVSTVPGSTICALGEAACTPLYSALEKFPEIFE